MEEQDVTLGQAAADPVDDEPNATQPVADQSIADQAGNDLPLDPAGIRAALQDRRGEGEIGVAIAVALGDTPIDGSPADATQVPENHLQFRAFSETAMGAPVEHHPAGTAPTQHRAAPLVAENTDDHKFQPDDLLTQDPTWTPHATASMDMGTSGETFRHSETESVDSFGGMASTAAHSYATNFAAAVMSIDDVRHGDPATAIKNEVTQTVVGGQPTGNIYVDAIIDGSKWLNADTGNIYYFFAEGDPGDLGFDGHAWLQYEKDAFKEALTQYENVADVHFQEATFQSDANILWFKGSSADLDGNLGWHDFPNGEFPNLYGAFNDSKTNWNATTLTPGGDAFDTIIHELGHGLGLAHPHDGGIETDWTIFPGATDFGLGDNKLNQSIWTIMSYNPGWTGSPSSSLNYGQPLTPMAFDIAALQEIYGANTTYKLGDDTYFLPTVNQAGTGWTCIWDNGGTDTISGANSTKAVTIDLEDAPLDPAFGIHAGGYVSWQSGIAGGFTIANGVFIENAVGGTGGDTITGNEKNNTIDGGDGNDIINGLEGDDTIDGGKGNDTIDGGIGADKMTGGDGNDIFFVDDAGDKVIEAALGGTDTVKTTIDLDLTSANFTGQEIENLILLTGAIEGTGNALANSITGNDGDNILDGGGGADTLAGGKGDDIYIVDDQADKIVEAAGATNGTHDEIDTFVTFSLANAANVEVLRLIGNGDADGTGSKNSDTLFGNSGKNTLDGGDGNDSISDLSTLNGGGDDTLLGGKGNDTIQDDTGNNTLDGGDGNDTLNVTSTTGNDVLKGGAGTDTIDDFGGNNTVDGGAGDDTIEMHGTTGDDNIVGGDGNDTIKDNGGTNTIDGGKGNDTVWILGGSATTTGGDGDDDIFSFGATASTISGNGGNDDLQSHNKVDILDGGDGNDSLSSLGGSITMIGGKGNDIYTLTDGKETITEIAGEGTDTVTTFVGLDFSKGSLAAADIEIIQFVNPDLTIVGNGLNNVVTDKSNGGVSGDKLFGGAGNDTLIGGAGSDTLDGGTGNDTMTGGKGNDTYVVDSLTDKVNETDLFSTGDTVKSSITYSIAALKSVENLTLTGANGLSTDTDPINGTGNTLANTMTGNDGDNILDGGAGNDAYVGGKGDDTFIIDSKDELALISNTGTDGNGSDTIKTALQLGGIGGVGDPNAFEGVDGVENYVNTGTKAWIVDLSGATGVGHTLVGGSAADTLTGADEDDRLDGGKGDDTLKGGDGDDTYLVDSLGDKVAEIDGEGTDTVQTTMLIKDSAKFDEVENFTYTGTAAWTFTGNDEDNVITGNTGADKLSGGKGEDKLIGNAGNDTLDGGEGNDAMLGGKGNDTYFFDAAGDTFDETGGDGIDTVKSLVDVDLTGDNTIENITLVMANSSSPSNATGNNLNNIIIGADGVSGATTHLNGAGGNDTLIGGSRNDQLDGGTGNDTMTGGDGSDVYIVDSTGDKLVETSNNPLAASGFFDTVMSEISFSLASLKFVEAVRLTGSNGLSTDTDKINATGNDLMNYLFGNDGDNILDGGKGNDSYTGGKGDDTFIMDDVAELTNVSNSGNDGAGSDTIKTALQLGGTGGVGGPGAFTGVAGVENYVNTGTKAWNVDLSGAAGVTHTLTGGSAADTLKSSDGADTIDGGKGNDTMTGGAGADTFFVDSAGDTITDLAASLADGDTLFINRTINLASDAVFGGSFDNGGLTGTAALNITGNDHDNFLFGNGGANIIDGGKGADGMEGGKGNDTYLIDDAGDHVFEATGGGTDTVKSADFDIVLGGKLFQGEIENVTLLAGSADAVTGNDLNNVITGNDNGNTLSGGKGNDTLVGGTGADDLDGGEGNDTMTGGAGDDVYHIDSPTDKVVETLTAAKGGGVDEVISAISYSIAALANIDNLTLTTDGTGTDTVALNGSGNALANLLSGNDGDNVLDGGKGIDSFVGGKGDDTFVLDNFAELALISNTGTDGAGSDTIKTALALDSSTNLVDGVENYTYTGSKAWIFDISAETGVSHALTGGSGADKLTGSDADDRLDGGKGIDVLVGGDGNDTYIVDNVKDTVTEQSGEGTHDLVKSSVTFTLSPEVEDLTLTGTGAINGTGNGEDNIITGNDGKNVLSGLIGNDTLIGGKGDDTLTGGDGADTFAYHDIADRGTGKEVITDFNKADGDVLDIADLFTGGGPTDVADAFASGYLLIVTNPGSKDTVVGIDADGGGDNFAFLVTMKGANLAESDTASFHVT